MFATQLRGYASRFIMTNRRAFRESVQYLNFDRRNGVDAYPPTILRTEQARMFSTQLSLPRLPVPPLEQTLEKYLKTIRPLLTESEFEKSKKVVEQFGASNGIGPVLEQHLMERSKKHDNWLAEWWLRLAYLEYRLPVTIHSSPGLLFAQKVQEGVDGQVRFASKFIAGVLDYKSMIDNQTLPVDRLGDQPLCMAQYYKLFGACRIPKPQRDGVICYAPDQPDRPDHIVVVYKNHFFKLRVYDEEERSLNPSQIEEQLRAILGRVETRAPPVGILTSEQRDEWAQVYPLLRQDPANASSLDEIERSLFVVCLDDEYRPQGEGLSPYAGQMLHGAGSGFNSGNRWFDKTLQFIIGRNGFNGLIYEHAPAEGPPVVAVTDHALEYCAKAPAAAPTATAEAPTLLSFHLGPPVLDAIERAKKKLDGLIGDLQVEVLVFDSFGKNFPKSQRLPPDAFIQVALQLAYFRLHGEPCASYESGSIRRFQLGRTETIRSCSMESDVFARSFDDSSCSASEKRNRLIAAVQAHRRYTDDAVNGRGVDRHLLGLKMIAAERGIPLPELYKDPAFGKSCHWRLSTSQVPAKQELVMCFGPVVPDGYGVCYNPLERKMLFALSAFRSCPSTDASRLSDSLRRSLNDMITLFPNTAKL